MKTNLTSADGSFLGYLFQIERVIQWLSELHDDAAFVGIEVADDIVVKLNNGADISEIYEQAKHANSNSIPYGDKSESLWKTLANWVQAVVDKKVNPDKAKFSLLSNKALPSSRFAHKLSKACFLDENNLENCYSELLQIASSLRKGLKEYGDKIQDCPKDTLKKIINNIIILDSDYTHEKKDYLNKLRGNLHLSQDMPISEILDKLFGFVSNNLIDCWRNHQEGWFEVRVFNQQVTQLIAEYKRKSFFERTTDSLPISSSDIAKNKGKIYVEQLKLINCEEDEILDSIHDYLRALSERDRFAKDGEISSEKFDQYFDDLADNWKIISKPRFRFCEEKDFFKVGYEVFYETLKYRGKLNNYEPEQKYTYKGAYHHLSNELLIGWHPQWKKKLEE